eukprot:1824469-Pyramimonas_sp.AAC.1
MDLGTMMYVPALRPPRAPVALGVIAIAHALLQVAACTSSFQLSFSLCSWPRMQLGLVMYSNTKATPLAH